MSARVLAEKYGDREVDRLDGYCDFGSSEIYISEEIEPEHREVTLAHELLHAILTSSGILHWLDSSRKKAKGETLDEYEETLVHLLAPQLVQVFKSAGLWVSP